MIDFMNRISSVKLDKEFEPLEELLKDDKIGFLNFLRTLKLCYELVEQKSEEKNTEEFRKNCENELRKFLCDQYYTSRYTVTCSFRFHGNILIDNLYAGRNGYKVLFPERCACHYATLRSLLRSAHYGEEMPKGDERMEWAYYDFTLLFCPIMNCVAQSVSNGIYLEKWKINPSTHTDYVVDVWKLKIKAWEAIEKILRNECWDESKISQLCNLFFRTIQYPDIFLKDNKNYVNWIQYLLSEFVEQVGARRYPLCWKRLYSGAYMDSNKVEEKKKRGRKAEIYESGGDSILVDFMYSILWRTVNQMNSSDFEMFSLSANPFIDLYKYCPVEKKLSKKVHHFSVNGERIRNFSFFPSGLDIDDNSHDEQNYQAVCARIFHLVYAPVNGIWKGDRPQDAVSFYHFIVDWVMEVMAGEVKSNPYSLKDLLSEYEFSFEIYPEELKEDKDLLIELKEFAGKVNLIPKNKNSKITWQKILSHSCNTRRKDSSELPSFVGQDQEVVTSSLCFCEDDAIYIKKDEDVPDNLNPKKSYIVDFTHEEFIAFLMYIGRWQKKIDGSRVSYRSMKERMKEFEVKFVDFGRINETKQQKIFLKINEKLTKIPIVSFPIIINRRSKNDCWELTERDKLKVKEIVLEFLSEKWEKVEDNKKKFHFIRLIIEDNMINAQKKFRGPNGDIYKADSCDSEIAFLKRLVFR